MKKIFGVYLISYFAFFGSHVPAKADETPLMASRARSSELVDWVSNTSFVLMRSYWLAQENLSRCYLPLIEGEYGQKDDLFHEILWRICTHLWALPLLMVSLPLLIIGNALFLTVRIFSPLDFQTYENLDAPYHPPSETITFFHLNACMMQGQLPVLFGGMTPATWRVENLTQKIKELDSDVVVLCEVNGCVASTLLDQLKDRYRHFYYRPGANYHFKMSFNPFGHDSNLFIASKITPAKPPKFVPFLQQGYGKQLLIKRGYFQLDLGPIVLFFTHLHPLYLHIDQTIRKAQLHEAESAMLLEYKPTLLIGDLNIDYLHNSQEFEETVSSLGLKPVGVVPSKDKKTYTKAFDLQRQGKPIVDPYEFDDYVLSTHELSAKGEIIPMNTEPPLKGYSARSLSDHDGIYVEVNARAN